MVSSGVGQGSILGPLLFLAFFNDSEQYDSQKIFPLNFADDKKIAAIIRSNDDALMLQRAINKFYYWCNDNDLECNRSKCKIMTFTHKRTPIIYDYQLAGHSIERINKIRDLGVDLDQKLNFNLQNETVDKKSTSALQFVKRQSYLFTLPKFYTHR